MKQILHRLTVGALGMANAYPTRLTGKSDLQQLIQRLHPISPGVELRRLGPIGDGGYLVPNDLSGLEACFSLGVGGDSGFEKDCAELGMEVFLADKSVDRPAASHSRFHFTRKYIGAMTSDDFMTMDDWVNASLPRSQSDLLLQSDIEGYEYETLLNIPGPLLKRFRVIVIEFHQLHTLWSQPFFALASRVFEKLLQSHTCVHAHPNNCCGLTVEHGIAIPRVMEFTFLRKDRVTHPSFTSRFPNPLDRDNTGNPPLPLPACWYRK